MALTDLLEKKTKGEKVEHSYKTIASAIEQASQAKQQIENNVNPLFALTNFVFSINK